MTNLRDQYDVTEQAHADCPDCDALIFGAIAHAAVRGSSGGTVIEDRTRVGGTIHSVTVTRTRCQWKDDGCLCPVCQGEVK